MNGFKRIYNLSNFGVTANQTFLAGQYSRVGQVTVPAQQEVTFGANDATGGASVSGSTVYLNLIDDSADEIDGTVRFVLANANETRREVVLEERTEKLRASQYDRTQAVLLPEQPLRAKEDSKLIIEIQVDGSSSVTFDYDATNSKALIPVTVYQG